MVETGKQDVLQFNKNSGLTPRRQWGFAPLNLVYSAAPCGYYAQAVSRFPCGDAPRLTGSPSPRTRTVNAKRWDVVRSIAWAARFRRLARGFERSPEILAGVRCPAFAILILRQFFKSIAHVP